MSEFVKWKRGKHSLCTLFLFLCFTEIPAQEAGRDYYRWDVTASDSADEGNWNFQVGMVKLALGFSGMEVNRRISDRQAITLGVYQLRLSQGDFHELNNVVFRGWGVDMGYKWYLDARRNQRFYFMLELTYDQFYVHFDEEDYYSYVEDGVEYWTYGDVSRRRLMQRPGLNLIWGMEKRLWPYLMMNIYGGVGIRLLAEEPDEERLRDMQIRLLNPMYTGFLPQFGLKLGFYF